MILGFALFKKRFGKNEKSIKKLARKSDVKFNEQVENSLIFASILAPFLGRFFINYQAFLATQFWLGKTGPGQTQADDGTGGEV